jgi:hypothetical protein
VQAEISPTPLVWIAGWPLATLFAFGPESGRPNGEADRAGPPGGDAREYHAEIERQRQVLHTLTCRDDRFMRALALAHPELAEHVCGHDFSRRNKRTRHLETTLYRYLARAVGRAAPRDFWAGATLACWGRETQFRPAETRTQFSPDLRPFRTILAALAGRSGYVRTGHFRLNSTLQREPGGSWTYCTRQPRGVLVTKRIGSLGRIADLVQALAGKAPCEFPDLLRIWQAAAGDGRTESDLAQEIEVCIRAGLLLGGLEIPWRFERAWDALQDSLGLLTSPERDHWQTCLDRLRALADSLQARCEVAPVAEIIALLREAVAAVEALAAACGVPIPSIPRVILRCDRSAPFIVQLGPEVEQQVMAVLGRHERARRHDDLRQSLRRSTFDWLRARGGSCSLLEWLHHVRKPTTATDNPPPAANGSGLAPSRRAGSRDEAAGQAPPFGSLVLRGLTSAGFAPRMLGTSDSLTASYSRHHALLTECRPAEAQAFLSWGRQMLRRASEASGVLLVDLVAPFETNPNVLAGPLWCAAHLELWGASAGGLQLQPLEIYLDVRRHELPLVRAPQSDRPVAFIDSSASNRFNDDLLTRLLLQTSFGPCELEAGTGRAPPARSQGPESGAALPGSSGTRSRQKTVLADADWAALIQARGAARFALWQEHANQHGWPAIISLRPGNGPPFLMHRDSALALEAILEGAHSKGAPLLVEDPFEDATVLQEGSTHLAELIVPFARSEHGWLLDDRAPLTATVPIACPGGEWDGEEPARS